MLGTRILESAAQVIPSLLPGPASGFFPSPSSWKLKASAVRKRQLLWEGINELGDAGRDSHSCAHKARCGAVRGGGKEGHLGLGQHSLPALPFLPSYGIE